MVFLCNVAFVRHDMPDFIGGSLAGSEGYGLKC